MVFVCGEMRYVMWVVIFVVVCMGNLGLMKVCVFRLFWFIGVLMIEGVMVFIWMLVLVRLIDNVCLNWMRVVFDVQQGIMLGEVIEVELFVSSMIDVEVVVCRVGSVCWSMRKGLVMFIVNMVFYVVRLIFLIEELMGLDILVQQMIVLSCFSFVIVVVMVICIWFLMVMFVMIMMGSVFFFFWSRFVVFLSVLGLWLSSVIFIFLVVSVIVVVWLMLFLVFVIRVVVLSSCRFILFFVCCLVFGGVQGGWWCFFGYFVFFVWLW